MGDLMRCMPHVYDGSFRSEENLARFPHGATLKLDWGSYRTQRGAA